MFWYVLIALLVGVLLGRVWAFFIRPEPAGFRQEGSRGSANYILGLNYLISNQTDLAILELGKAAKLDSEAVEVFITLGNLFREKGHVERAIQIHKGVLHRSHLSEVERNQVLLYLGIDFKKAGIIDRAVSIFEELIQRDPDNVNGYLNLAELYEELKEWEKAYAVHEKVLQMGHSTNRMVLGFVQNELGLISLRNKNYPEAIKRFQRAISTDSTVYPAYISLGDAYLESGEPPLAINSWEKLIAISPLKSYLLLDRLKRAYEMVEEPARYESLLVRLAGENQKDWRVRIALAEHERDRGKTEEAYRWLLEASHIHPHSLTIHQFFWRLLLEEGLPQDKVEEYVDTTREMVFFIDPYICLKCHYKTTELLWRCPHCHAWNSFVEEKV